MNVQAHAIVESPGRSLILDVGAEMLARHIGGDDRAFAELVERFGPGVFAFLKRSGLGPATAEDLFQETFLRVHRSAPRYDSAYPFRTWLFTIANNLLRSYRRKERIRRVLCGWWRRSSHQDPYARQEGLDPPDASPDAERRTAVREQLRFMEQALKELPEGPQRALLLTRLEGLSVREAARVLGVPMGTVKTWVHRGRLALAAALAEHEGGPS